MKTTFLKWGGLCALMLVMSFQMQAQKLGYINSQALLSMMPEVKQADSKIEALGKQLQKQGESKVQAYQTKAQDAQSKKELGQLSPNDEQKVLAELKSMEDDLAKFDQTLQQEIVKKRKELYEPLIKKIDDSIKAVATENGYSFIFDTSVGAILYASDNDDVTALVKKKLNIQ
jgi:outer membrane protein